ncbi:proton extrusion protein PcxA [Leptolyngbya ohadii]|uniref:proton extrusion protein PcxA n=1 Tax=Leptolyngbya ohadii TaxID=1962290 RepID=UPI001CED7C60|nr:proton extrusion protein PcxA [Leptolyngbya ohadii]
MTDDPISPMRNSALANFRGYIRSANRWLKSTPERALDQAYEAALAIKALEDAHFDGNPIALDSGDYTRSAKTYLKEELKKYLDIIRIRLFEFKASSSIVRLSNQAITEVQLEENSGDLPRVAARSGQLAINVIDRPNLILKKLRFIDDVLARYSNPELEPGTVTIVANPQQNGSQPLQQNPTPLISQPGQAPKRASRDMKSLTDKTGVLPRSILETVDRVRRELDPESEQEVVQDFRQSKTRTVIALRFILLLIIVPLLTQQFTKNFVVGPIVDHYRVNSEQAQVFINQELEDEALDELQRFEQRIRFEILVGQEEPKSEEEIQELLRDRAAEIQQDYRDQGSDAIKNVFADLFGLMAFGIVIATGRQEIAVVKSFMDQLVYGLSDSAKAFIIILFTDIFVGFHSPHGWEVILEGVSRHFGLPANRDFIFLFIATFPVILDTIFKYWIFRYLNRVSPSAVATYRNMNE